MLPLISFFSSGCKIKSYNFGEIHGYRETGVKFGKGSRTLREYAGRNNKKQKDR